MTGFDKVMSMSNTFIGWVGEAGTVKMEDLNDTDIIDQLVELLGHFTDERVPYPRRYYMYAKIYFHLECQTLQIKFFYSSAQGGIMTHIH